MIYEDPRDLSTSFYLYKARNSDVIALFDAMDHPNLYRVRPDEVFCDTIIPDRCATIVDGRPLYRDDDHLSHFGAALLSEKVLEVIATIPVDGDLSTAIAE